MKFEEYNVIDKIGEGGFGEVFAVEKDGNCYALKTCTKTEEEYLKRFKREIRLMESVTHENVINILDSNTAHTPPYFVMPLCQGSLHNKNYNKDVESLITDIHQICNGLEALHNNSQRIIHRDIKPNNVLVNHGVLKLSDLGLGKFEDRDSTPITPSAIMMGTAGYAPPEFYQIGGTKNATISSDIFQLGKTIYSLFTNEYPAYFDKNKVPNGLFYIVRKCTNENPDDRYQNIAELRNALIRHLEILKGENNPYIFFDNLIAELHKKGASKEDVYNLFNVLYEFKEDPDIFYSKAKAIPVKYFSHLNDGDLLTFVDVYNDIVIYLKDIGKLSWPDAETIADQMKKVCNSTKDIEIRTKAMRITLFFAASFNRYNAMEVFNSMLTSVKTEEEAISVASMLNDHLNEYENIVLQQDRVDGLHPHIQGIRNNIIKSSKK
ncbi:serine/threonine protein kinase [Aquipluma nitroreducens]|uniref:Serine/threonine protein kinase n=1 Tax=Aquipluma nitroreducens TaxID=2010828 RepID=A0A5K7SAV6_9BACT|nr:serine/threonine-protein kinase [Aquipluma nitroreducens]BBE18577.1 serine/threonine protein kinase [Aquipluma nitroreducens]